MKPPTHPLPSHVAPYDDCYEVRADSSLWRSTVFDMGRHYAVVWKLVRLP